MREKIEPGSMKTTITLDAALWKAVKIRAIEEQRGFRAIVADALRLYLSQGKKEPEGRRSPRAR